MSVAIRLARKGKTGDPVYRIVIMEKRTRQNGRTIDELGSYDPHMDPPLIIVDRAKLEKWIKNGAQMTPSVKRLVKNSAKS